MSTNPQPGVEFGGGQAGRPALFSPLRLRSVEFRNRIAVSPMCQYSAEDGVPNDWHLVHLGSRAVGGAALVIVEATAVEPRGRISPGDLGIWNGTQVQAFRRITRFLKQQGSVPGIQIAHAGRKASTAAPWQGGAALAPEQGGWETVAPSPIPFAANDPLPHALSPAGIARVVSAFGAAARLSLDAGFEVLEIHAAHGYLLHQFCSPLANQRTDLYGGSFENRTRIVREVAQAVRVNWPEHLPLLIRLSATDWVEGGWSLDESVELSRALKPLGVDLVDCSSGAIVPGIRIPVAPSYQAPFAERIRREAGIPTGAVGMITEAAQANELIAAGKADLVLLARQFLRDPYWPLRAARELGVAVEVAPQYRRAF